MSNMSYCRWENTSNAMKDCVNDLVEDLSCGDGTIAEMAAYFADLSIDEKRGFLDLLADARELVEMTDNVDFDMED